MKLTKKLSNQKGQSLTEYGLILVLVAVGAIAIMGAFGTQIKSKIGLVTTAMDGGNANARKEVVDRSKKVTTFAVDETKKANTLSGEFEQLDEGKSK